MNQIFKFFPRLCSYASGVVVWVRATSSRSRLGELLFPEVFFVINHLLSLDLAMVHCKADLVEGLWLAERVAIACADLVRVQVLVWFPSMAVEEGEA